MLRVAGSQWLAGLLLFLTPLLSFAVTVETLKPLDLTHSWAGYFSLVAVVLAYVFAMLEDVTYLRKSKPMLFGASLVWVAILIVYRQHGDTHLAIQAFRETLLAYILECDGVHERIRCT
jgi:hypothetical protein